MMKDFQKTYDNQTINKEEILFAIPSMVLGIGILTLPRTLSGIFSSGDMWISIALAGTFMSLLAFLCIKVASPFQGEEFIDYVAKIATKPVAYFITFFMLIHFLSYAFFETRTIANLSKQFLFDQTPVEVISLLFVLLLAYAVAGSRAALLRLNVMFFPIVFGILLVILLFNIPHFEFGNLRPFFSSNLGDISEGVKESIFSFIGFEILLFYIVIVDNKQLKKVGKYSFIGLGLITFMYLLVLFFSLGVYTLEGTEQLLYPTIELAKTVQIPGGIIERLESLFFTIWIMTIFNTSAMALDISLICLRSLVPKLKKSTCIFILLPLIYVSAMIPQDVIQLNKIGEFIGYSGLIAGGFIPIVLFILLKIRGVA